MELRSDALLALYYLMALTRALEDAVRDLPQQGESVGTVQTAHGYEATTVGAAFALAAGDVLAPQHRDLGALLARGITPREVLAQWLRRDTALAQGRDGQLHLGDMRERMIIPATAVPGVALPVAVGTALAAKARGERRVTLAFISEGDSNTGSFHEALNLAATLDLPFICVIENQRDTTTSQFRVKHLADRAAAYGIPGHVVDGSDVLAIHEATLQAVEVARAGRGPSLIEAKIVRTQEPMVADQAGAVPISTLDTGQAHDPLEKFTQHLMEAGVLTEARVAENAERISQTVQDARDYAHNSPAPDPATLTAHLFAEETARPMGPAATPALARSAIERKSAWN